MKQLTRNFTDCIDGFLAKTGYPILDRDSLDTRPFREMLKTAGVTVVRVPARSPNLNAFAGTARAVDQVRVLGPVHSTRRTHGNDLIERLPATTVGLLRHLRALRLRRTLASNSARHGLVGGAGKGIGTMRLLSALRRGRGSLA